MTTTQTTEITLTVTGLCPMIFDSDNERAAFGIFHDRDHQTVLKVDNVDWSQSFNGIASLTVHRALGSHRQNRIVRKADNVVTDPSQVPAGDLSFSHVVDIQKNLYGGLHLPMQTGLLKARLILNDGEFSVSKLFNGGAPGAPPRKVWFVPENNLSKVVYENYVAEELMVRIYLEKDDFAFLTFDNGDFVYLYGDQNHSIVMSNMCDPDVIASGQDDFILQYNLYRMGDHPRVIPQYDPPGTIAPRQGTSMCIGGSNCIPPGSCT
ncbi:MAG TPA: hypothetical protein PLL06_12540 [Acidobacteriota bacterium]|nr:hypothetical protein [Acidobacteriota bacterium]HMZ80521.1 hypothetical protein [Acidobacteriota bacterium]HNG91899.1 hypothetical protein [Acidobacteriota bacterium]HNH83149.1 hypothetical protein [Acidobacteriota bacterium]HNJ40669.1 hypothetical protein [Acidobacteriota bacterium]